MTSLEWINGKIEIFNRKIKLLNSKLNHKHTGINDPLELDLTIEAIQTALSYATQTLQTLNQIKVELEAWEVVKQYIFTGYSGNFIMRISCDEDEVDNEELEDYQKVKKALEGKYE